jgi:trigger factor
MASDSSIVKVTVHEPQAWSRRLSITVPADRVQRTRTAIASQFARSARLPGFRKGKLPTRVIEQRFGPSIEQETLDRLIQDAYREALDTEGFTPITQGKVASVQYDQGKDLEFEVEFDVRPEIELGRITGFKVTREPVTVGDADIESVLERLRDDRAEWEPLEDGARPDYGDRATVDITALETSEGAGDGAEPRTYRVVLGEGQAIPGVEAAIVTLAPGEEAEFDVKFPDDFPEEARRGEAQRLRIRMTEAHRKVLPELDDELAKAVGDFESLDALRARIMEDLQADAAQRTESQVRQQLLQEIVEANAFEVPGSMIERFLDQMTGHSHGDGEDDHQHSPEEDERLALVRDGLRPQAEFGLKRMLVVERIAEQEGLQATQDEIDERVEKLAEQHGRSPSEVWIQLEKSGQLEVLEREITEDKVFEHLKAQNTVE